MHPGAVNELFARTLENFFEFALGLSELLLVKKRECLVVELELGLNAGVDQLDAATLGRMLRG
jgi:hypothetical protein